MGSIVAALLKWTGLSQGVMELIAIGAVASTVAGIAVYEHHKIYTEGVTAEHAKTVAQNVKDTAILQAKATTAEKNFNDAQKQLSAFSSSNPIEPVRLCISTPAAHVQGAPAVRVGGSTATPTVGVQPVPAGNSGSGPGQPGPDISAMLAALAARADAVANQARELQSR